MISLTRSEIEALIDFTAAAKAIEAAYCATSLGKVNIPPVGHITFPYEADCHIKYGHMNGDPNFVIKVATGFPRNGAKGLPSGNGLVLVLSAETGTIEAMLHDEMVLTDIRTGIGGAIASRMLARSTSKHVLIVGTGPQARRQIEAHAAAKGLIIADDLQEIGALLNGYGHQRENESQITIADLTGIAAQDIAMANTVLAAWRAQSR